VVPEVLRAEPPETRERARRVIGAALTASRREAERRCREALADAPRSTQPSFAGRQKSPANHRLEGGIDGSPQPTCVSRKQKTPHFRGFQDGGGGNLNLGVRDEPEASVVCGNTDGTRASTDSESTSREPEKSRKDPSKPQNPDRSGRRERTHETVPGVNPERRKRSSPLGYSRTRAMQQPAEAVRTVGLTLCDAFLFGLRSSGADWRRESEGAPRTRPRRRIGPGRADRGAGEGGGAPHP
jgi:hypothetical protein